MYVGVVVLNADGNIIAESPATRGPGEMGSGEVGSGAATARLLSDDDTRSSSVQNIEEFQFEVCTVVSMHLFSHLLRSVCSSATAPRILTEGNTFCADYHSHAHWCIDQRGLRCGQCYVRSQPADVRFCRF